MKNTLRLFFYCYLITSFITCKNHQQNFQTSIIPQPVEIRFNKGTFNFNQDTKLICEDKSLDFSAQYAAALWEPIHGYKPDVEQKIGSESKNSIAFRLLENPEMEIGNEGYILEINSEKAVLSANTPAGILYGIQTITQLMDSENIRVLPSCFIKDYPRFAWRGLHLDVSRHFMPLEFMYKLMDYMAMHKLNVFHWHLVDDQGWRLEIKKYPKLTGVGAWRVDMLHLHWNERPLINDTENASYGGFYTQDEIRALVAYADERNITVVPEIEMPAHVMSALAAYPELSCTGENLGVPPGGVWPITHIYCAGKDETFTFLENVLLEVMDLFPSEYIHIGGDEADKTNWRSCTKCQARIKNENLADEDGLQSYFIQRIERFLNEHGRKIIGWDEILEGGLAPNASVMSWRGEQGGIEAAKMGHHVVMTPGSHCYFDHYQGDPAIEPLAIGGNTTLKKVYNYEPIPTELTAEEAKLVLGAQANVWTEYMPTKAHVEYMVFPRLAAMAEVVWSPKETRNWADFSRRMEHQYRRYKRLGINYSQSAFQVSVKPEVNPTNRSLVLSLITEVNDSKIRYTLDGSIPGSNSPMYKRPVEINESATLKVAVFLNGISTNQILERSFDLHKAFATEVELQYPTSTKYDGTGAYSLVDGISGSKHFNDGFWKGFLGDDMIATIRFQKLTDISSIEVDALQNYASWIFLPEKVVFEVSEDGSSFRKLDEIATDIPQDEKGKLIKHYKTTQSAENITAIRVSMKNPGTCPPGHSGEGQKSWLFVSEIIVR
ncbi:MAG: family 20 glycosylhydrolase [Bacteroidales bacterium]|nr:family 20 glycosylhydrolase [Bacteroidales bacterium]